MALKFIGVKRRLRRGTRRMGRKKYFGPTGWGWNEINISNTFTDIDNDRTGAQLVVSGGAFDEDINTSFGGSNNRQVVMRRIIAQFFGAVQLGDAELYPYLAWDVALVKVAGNGAIDANVAAGLTMETIQTDTRHRVLAHSRTWFGTVPGTLTPAESEQFYSTVSSTNLVQFDISPNVSFTENDSLQVVVCQAESELYIDQDSISLQGFVKYFGQQK